MKKIIIISAFFILAICNTFANNDSNKKSTNTQKIEVKIGNALGYFESSIPIYNKQKIYIAEELTFKHYNVSKGYFEVKINDKIYDTKVFVK